jgi:superfamily II DNA or RNA helicase
MHCVHPFRHYQELALAAFERARAGADRHIYLTMPPGSGKTLLGLEIGRRLGRPIVALAPTTAIQGQWAEQWTSAFAPPSVTPTTDGRRAAGLGHGTDGVLALTYQSIVIIDPEPPGDDAGEAARPGPSDARDAAAARRGDPDAVLGLLHANGRAILDALAGLGPITLILDECHHLLRLWGHVLEAVVARIHADSVVLGLTATPPVELGAREASLHRALFGGAADFEVVTPAVVKDGYLAPYQELALLVAPLDTERRFIDQEQERFERLRQEIMDPGFATVPFASWFARRFLDRRSEEGATAGWHELEREDPALARAALRLRWWRDEPPPHGARFGELHRLAPDTADLVALLEAWVREVLAPSQEEVDRGALERIRRALPSVGYRLTRHGISAMASVTDRVLRGSGAKPAALVRVLDAEASALGERLRAVVLCDHERAGLDPGAKLRGVLEPGAGGAALVHRTLLTTPGTAALHPVLVTGRTVVASRRTAADLVAFAAGDPVAGPILAGFDALSASGAGGRRATRQGAGGRRATDLGACGGGADAPSATWDEAIEIDPAHPGWTSGTWVPLMTRYFEAGRTRCLVGTRALLGEGWDCPAVNVLVDLGSATTAVSTRQVRGRSLRLDPAQPFKVADNWDIVCVSDHDGGSGDYARFVRRHADYYALTHEGEIESGVSHVDPELGPFGPPAPAAFGAIGDRMLARAGERSAVHAAWRIGETYRDIPVPTIRVRAARSPGLSAARLWEAAAPRWVGSSGRALGLAAAAAGAVPIVTGAVLGVPLVGLIVAAVLVGALGSRLLWGTWKRMGDLTPSDTLGDIGRAVAEALAATGRIDATADADAVRVLPQPDGYSRCLLEGVSEADAGRFAAAMEDVLAPLWEPRWIIGRRVIDEQRSLTGAARALAARLPGRVAPGRVTYHAVPDLLATSRERVAVFERSWARWVSPGQHAVRATDPGGEGILAAHRGEDPFRIETQLRTLWT